MVNVCGSSFDTGPSVFPCSCCLAAHEWGLLAVAPTRELRWKGKLLLPGLFDGEHYFKLEAAPNGGVLFRQGEKFTGLLVPLFRKSLNGATKQGFIAVNEALKREAE